MAEERQLVFEGKAIGTTETIVAMEVERIPSRVVDHPVPGTLVSLKPVKGIRTAGMARVLFTCCNNSLVAGTGIVFRAKPAPGAVNPDTGDREFIDPAWVTPSLQPGDNTFLDIRSGYPFFIVTATADKAGEHDVVVHMDGYVRER